LWLDSATTITIDDLLFPRSIDRHIGKGGFGDLEFRSLACRLIKGRFDPDLKIDGDRGGADAQDPAITADYIADMYRLYKDYGFGGDGDDAATGNLPGENAAGDIHLRHDPTAENVAVRVGIGGHGQGPENKLALRDGIGFHGCFSPDDEDDRGGGSMTERESWQQSPVIVSIEQFYTVIARC
jgi:hypothetical protein